MSFSTPKSKGSRSSKAGTTAANTLGTTSNDALNVSKTSSTVGNADKKGTPSPAPRPNGDGRIRRTRSGTKDPFLSGLKGLWSLISKLRGTRTGISLLLVRIWAALYFPMSDCDEQFNYWEPLHFMMFKHGGKQTWEYSSEYALRSYFFLMLYGWPAALWEFVTAAAYPKVYSFYVVRVNVALVTAMAEFFFLYATTKKFGGTTAALCWVLLLACTGPTKQAVNFLPSSFSMTCYYVAAGAWLLITTGADEDRFEAARVKRSNSAARDGGGSAISVPSLTRRQRVEKMLQYLSNKRQLLALAIFATVMVPVVGWPFAALIGVPLALHIIFHVTLHNSPTWLFAIFGMGVFFTAVLALMTLAVDTLYYCKPVLAAWNIVAYNVFPESFGDPNTKLLGKRGPEIFGVEPASFFFKNLFLNFNFIFIFALLSYPLAILGIVGGKVKKALLSGSSESSKKDSDSEAKQLFSGSSNNSSSSSSSNKHPVNPQNLLIYCAPFNLWFVFWLTIPHKEERFFAPAYPFLLLAGSLTFYYSYRCFRLMLWPAPLQIKAPQALDITSTEPQTPAVTPAKGAPVSGSVSSPKPSVNAADMDPISIGDGLMSPNLRRRKNTTAAGEGTTPKRNPSFSSAGGNDSLAASTSGPGSPRSATKEERKAAKQEQVEAERRYAMRKSFANRASQAYLYAFITVVCLLGVSRTLGEYFFYSGVEQAFYHHFSWREDGYFNEFDPLWMSTGLQSGRREMNPNRKVLCLAEDWFRFPSSFFLPRYSFDYEFIKTKAFNGALPKSYQYSTHGANATCVPNKNMNDLNLEDPGQYVQSPAACDFIVDSSPTYLQNIEANLEGADVIRRNRASTQAKYAESQLAATFSDEGVSFRPMNEGGETKVFRILDAANTPLWCRLGWVPFLTDRCANWIPVVAVRNPAGRVNGGAPGLDVGSSEGKETLDVKVQQEVEGTLRAE